MVCADVFCFWDVVPVVALKVNEKGCLHLTGSLAVVFLVMNVSKHCILSVASEDVFHC